MASRLTREEGKRLWDEFFELFRIYPYIQKVVETYPDEKSVEIPFHLVQEYDPDLAVDFLENPLEHIEMMRAIVRRKYPSLPPYGVIYFRFYDLPRDVKREVRNLRSRDLGRMVSIKGIVKKSSEVRPRLYLGAFKCANCDDYTFVLQHDIRISKPQACERCGLGAGKTRFTLVPEASIFMDVQKVELLDLPEEMRGGEQPQRITAYLFEDLAGRLVPGDRVILNGVLLPRQRRGPQQSTDFDIYLHVISIEKLTKDEDLGDITPEDEKAIRELASDPNVIDRLVASIAPEIHGMHTVKEALLLQLFGGVPKKFRSGTRIRGDIHILLLGDPGTAKSQLLRYMADLAPRGIYTSGKSASAAGLTAAAVKDEFGEGGWTLEAGALVLADMGLAAIDELDKMSPQDRSAMHEAMEQQTIHVTKAGINAVLMSRCSVLAAANPKYGRFDENRPIVEQIDLPPPLISRFDVIFKIIDRPDPQRDARLAEHMLNQVHRRGEILARATMEGYEVEMPVDERMISTSLLKKYIAYAKRKIIPTITDEVAEAMNNFYVTLRRRGIDDDSIPITPRQLDALVRLAEASARARLSEKVSMEDFERAKRIMMSFMSEVATDEGIVDMTVIHSGMGRKTRKLIDAVMGVIKEKYRDLKAPVHVDEIVKGVRDSEGDRYSREEILEAVEKLYKTGRIIEKRHGMYEPIQY